MSKVYSSGLLLALIFSPAHTPTVNLWRTHGQPEANASPTAVTLAFAEAILDEPLLALSREFTEDDAIKPLRLDDFYLPTLEVSLPSLLEGRDDEREYLADAVNVPSFAGAPAITAVDRLNRPTLPVYGASSSFRGVGGGEARGSSGATPAAAPSHTKHEPSGADPQGTAAAAEPAAAAPPSNTSEPPLPSAPPAGTPGNSGTPSADDTPPSSDIPREIYSPPAETPPPVAPPYDGLPPIFADVPNEYVPIQETAPVAVPAPGTLPLFMLGLAGLRWAGRKKKMRPAAS
jgi:hypothetical protein